MRILVSGSRGLVGSNLVPLLRQNGHEVVRLVRSFPQPGDILWNPEKGELNAEDLEGLDAVVHLAGDNIASGRWTTEKKNAIRTSRVDGTKLLCDTLASLKKRPEVIISASAIGYYGDRASEILTEKSKAGTGFLADVCRDWEAATVSAQAAGIRVALLRIGVVLSREGGALTKMLPPFRAGVGGKLGSGKQYLSWISIDDLCSIILHTIKHHELNGPVNAVSPNPVTNEEFTSALGATLKRPTIFPVPEFAAHLLLGEMADELLLSSALVKPEKLVESGYQFSNPQIQQALKCILNAA